MTDSGRQNLKHCQPIRQQKVHSMLFTIILPGSGASSLAVAAVTHSN